MRTCHLLQLFPLRCMCGHEVSGVDADALKRIIDSYKNIASYNYHILSLVQFVTILLFIKTSCLLHMKDLKF